MSNGFDFYVNGGGLDEVNAAQLDNLNRFFGIMQQIHDVAYETKTHWTGEGTDSYIKEEQEFSKQFDEVNAAFGRLIDNSEEATESFKQMMTRASTKFQ